MPFIPNTNMHLEAPIFCHEVLELVGHGCAADAEHPGVLGHELREEVPRHAVEQLLKEL